jgi:hypothetical protein
MNDLIRNKTGAIKSKKDYRDQIFMYAMGAPSGPVPNILTDFSKFGVWDQAQTPSCVSHSVAKMLQLYWYLKSGKVVDFNPQFLHILSAFSGAGPDDGRDPRTVLQTAAKFGCCTTATLPRNTSVTNTQYFDTNLITQAMRDEAMQYAGISFVPISVDQGSYRSAIKTYGAVSALFEVGNTFWTTPTGAVTWDPKLIDPIRATSNLSGAHEITIIGDNNSDVLRAINSWGTAWDLSGYFNFIFNEWQPYIHELWAITDPNPAALATVQSLPTQDEFKHNFQTTIKYGMNNPEVRALQVALAIDGDFTYPEITGYYGTVTATAVTAFQIKYSVASPAEIASLQGTHSQCGPATRKALNNLFNK